MLGSCVARSLVPEHRGFPRTGPKARWLRGSGPLQLLCSQISQPQSSTVTRTGILRLFCSRIPGFEGPNRLHGFYGSTAQWPTRMSRLRDMPLRHHRTSLLSLTSLLSPTEAPMTAPPPSTTAWHTHVYVLWARWATPSLPARLAAKELALSWNSDDDRCVAGIEVSHGLEFGEYSFEWYSKAGTSLHAGCTAGMPIPPGATGPHDARSGGEKTPAIPSSSAPPYPGAVAPSSAEYTVAEEPSPSCRSLRAWLMDEVGLTNTSPLPTWIFTAVRGQAVAAGSLGRHGVPSSGGSNTALHTPHVHSSHTWETGQGIRYQVISGAKPKYTVKAAFDEFRTSLTG